jgi:acetyl esterase/lipase
MSASMALTVAFLHLRQRATQTAEALHRNVLAREESPQPPKSLRAIASIETLEVNGFEVIRLTPFSGATGTSIIYLHGGAYVFPLTTAHWKLIGKLITQTGATVTVPLYGLAPEHRADAAYDLLDAIYDAAQQPVFLVGDSAGAGLAIGYAMHARDTSRPPAAGVFAISPWLDATLGNPGIVEIAPRDPILAVRGLVEAGLWWAGARDTRDPMVSPLHGDVTRLPPVHLYQGGRDILAPDTIGLARRIIAAGGVATMTFHRTAFHVYTGAWWTPEARSTVRDIASIVRADG